MRFTFHTLPPTLLKKINSQVSKEQVLFQLSGPQKFLKLNRENQFLSFSGFSWGGSS
jgi:hypothetical protein